MKDGCFPAVLDWEGHCQKVLEKSENSHLAPLSRSQLYVGQPQVSGHLCHSEASSGNSNRHQREKCAHMRAGGQKAQEKQKADCMSNKRWS